MKRYFLMIMLLTLSLSIFAMPARKGTTRTLHLADGTTVVAQLCGDEYGHWWQTEDGQRFTMQDNEIAVRMNAEKFEALKITSDMKRRARNSVREERMAKSRKAWGNTIFTGKKKGLVILVNFSDKVMKSTSKQSEFDDMFNLVGYSRNNHIGSLHDYFYDQSYGQFDLEFDVVGPVKVSKTMAYYGKNDAYGDDMHPGEMVIEACRLADQEYDLNFADYDWDGNGEVDQVFLIYAGYGENANAPASTIWPHEYQLSAAASYGDGEGAIELDGVTVDTYAVASELAGSSGSVMNGIGTACHEFSHCLGYPDFYDIDYSGGWGMSGWDVMDGGSYNGPKGNGEIPSGYTSYERWVAGWIEPKELTLGMKVDALKPLGDEPDAYVLYNDGNSNEYYLLENRNNDRWFSYVETYTDISGLLIIHVDYSASAWNNNTPNDSKSHQRMTIIPASGQFPSYKSKVAYQNQLYPYGSKNSLTNETSPKASLFNKNTDGSKLMNKPIFDITKNDDGTISFHCGDIDNGDDGTGTGGGTGEGGDTGGDTGDFIFYESFNSCSGTGGNDDAWSGSIASAAFTADNEGWIYSKGYGADRCAKFGTGSIAGSATTPSFTLNGSATLSFKAACWDSTRDDITMTIKQNDEELTTVQLLRGVWSPYTLTITGDGATTLTFSTANRFFLDDVLVKAPSGTSGISNVNSIQNDVIYNLNGMRVGPDYKGIVIINGRKVMR